MGHKLNLVHQGPHTHPQSAGVAGLFSFTRGFHLFHFNPGKDAKTSHGLSHRYSTTKHGHLCLYMPPSLSIILYVYISLYLMPLAS